MSDGEKPLHDWRQCLISNDIPPVTRHVLLTLSLHMDVWGESCYPTVAQLMYETGLSKPSVIKHLAHACDTGWLARKEHGFSGQKWRNHEYKSAKPEGAVATAWKQSEEYKKTLKGKGSRNKSRKKVVNDINHLQCGKGGKPQEEGGKPDDERWLTSVNKVVNEVYPSTSVSYSVSTPESTPLITPSAKPPSVPQNKTEPKSSRVWVAYAGAYCQRYGAEPVRNQTVNSQLCKFVDRLGAESAPDVAAHYLTNNKRWYVEKRHSVGIMLQDAEALHNEWVTGTRTSSTQAAQMDRTQSNLSAIDQVIATRKAQGKM